MREDNLPEMTAAVKAAARGAKVVMMCGVSGSGKTVLSTMLERELGFVRICADEMIWQSYGNRIAELTPQQAMQAFQSVGAQLAERLAELLVAGRKVVVDSTLCKRMKRQRLREVCAIHDVEPVLIYLNAPIELLRQRLMSRTGSGPNDQIVTGEQLASYYAHFERPDADEAFIEIDQTDFSNRF